MANKERNTERRDTIFSVLFAVNFSVLVALAGYLVFTERSPSPVVGAAPSAEITQPAEAPTAAQIAPGPPVEVTTAGHPRKGSAEAPVTLVEFSDFECPFCSRLAPTLKQIESSYGDRVSRVFRQFPLTSIHPRAQKAAEASLCALEQGAFWEMHESLFEQPTALEPGDLRGKAQRLGLDMDSFDRCLDSGAQQARVMADLSEGARLGVTGTPAVFVNGRMISGARPYADFATLIDEELRKAGDE